MIIPETEVWERQMGESFVAYAAFCVYRDTDPFGRSVAKCVQAKYDESMKKAPLWRRWSVNHNWVERARAYDDYKDNVARHADIEALKEMKDRHIREAKGLQAKAITRLQSLDPERLNARDVLAYFIEASKLERLSMGAETERYDVTSDGKRIKGMTDDELIAYIKSELRKIDGGVIGSGQSKPENSAGA